MDFLNGIVALLNFVIIPATAYGSQLALGALGVTMGSNGVNIANFTLGRSDKGGDAIALLYVDEPVPAPAIGALESTGLFTQVRQMEFDVR